MKFVSDDVPSNHFEVVFPFQVLGIVSNDIECGRISKRSFSISLRPSVCMSVHPSRREIAIRLFRVESSCSICQHTLCRGTGGHGLHLSPHILPT
jgi:hypothetical protein